MKQLTILLILLTTFKSYGQEITADTVYHDFKRVQLGFNISPDYCFRTLENNNGSQMSALVLNLRNENEIAKIGYSAGVNVCFNIKKYFGLEIGVQYANKGYRTKTIGNYSGPDESIPAKVKSIYDFHYVDIPVRANFTIGKKKVRFITSVGLTTNIFIQEKVTSIFTYSSGTQKSTLPSNFNYNKVNVSPTISAGIDYKINNRMNLRIEPTFRYGLLKIIDAPVTGYLYSGGVNVSYYIGL